MHRWTKASRGADRSDRRPLLEPVYPLPEMAIEGNPQQVALVHEVIADCWADEPVAVRSGPVTHEAWTQGHASLDWRPRGKAMGISLNAPSRWRLQTKWPAWLPSPLFVLEPEETARIEWNGRFRYSLFGSNRSSYFEQHIYWLALTDAAHPRLFLDAEPRKNLDYTTHIY
ncbi:hypothetical protein [Sphingomonas soli]|uniref:hypothetical protein n=1 Tax=Sphingomonas soli TaxID=266127 RepID=UPI0012ECBB4C|nr:hypothetical protein [Sphingomonas soli]